MESKPVIGICGVGMVGQAMMQSLQMKGWERGVNLFGYDKYKDSFDPFEALLKTQIVFLALPTLFDESTQSYQLDSLDESIGLLKKHAYQGLIVIKSTVQPQTTALFTRIHELDIVHNPEFLTARTALEDFNHQNHVVLGWDGAPDNIKFCRLVDLYHLYYTPEHLTICTSAESESMKLFANSFYAVKVQFFTELYLLCQTMGVNYEVIRHMILLNGWVNPMHTVIPGPDGQYSYGGMCLPKDTKALTGLMEQFKVPCDVIRAAVREQELMRNTLK